MFSFVDTIYESLNSIFFKCANTDMFWSVCIVSGLFRLSACCNIVMQIQCITHNESLLSVPITPIQKPFSY